MSTPPTLLVGVLHTLSYFAYTYHKNLIIIIFTIITPLKVRVNIIHVNCISLPVSQKSQKETRVPHERQLRALVSCYVSNCRRR